jgi:PKD domain
MVSATGHLGRESVATSDLQGVVPLKPIAFPRYCAVTGSLCLAALLAGCGASTPSPSGPIPSANTTLKAETGNNTSTANSFDGQTNGNAGASNVSKLPITSLLYSGATTKIYGHLLGWFGKPNHISVGYQSNTAAQVHAQVQDMISRGMAGAIIDWYGPADPFIDGTAMLLKNEAEAHPGKFEFAITEDRGALAAAAQNNGCDVTDQLISDLNYIASQYESSPAYLRMNGRPVVFMFGVDAYYIDWNRIRSSVPGNPLLILRGVNGINIADGGFSWVNIQSSAPFNPELNLQDRFFQAAQKASQKVAVGAAFKGFNDTLASWGTNRVIDQNCGQTWIQSLKEIGKFYSSSNQLPILQVPTWNDYEEGTALETGIDNCVFLVPSQSGSTISWTVNGQENTIDHYTVFLSTDGKNLSPLIDVPAGTHSVDLSKLQISPNKTYFVFVKAVGLPSMENKMSPAIAYHPGDQPPQISLDVTQSGGLTYTASVSGSGAAAKSVIDFGDGTVVQGGNASHTYKAIGSYLITATAYDSAGASSVDVQRVSAKSAAGGVHIASPGGGATVNWPTPIVASANTGGPVSAMQVLFDGEVAYATHGDTINTSVKVFTGTHKIQVQALDASGNPLGSTSLNVNAEPNDIPPIAKITLTAMPQISPTTFLGCTVDSVDPDGFFISHSMKYSDGSHFSSPASLETFPGPGTYTATATVTDNFGATDTTTVTFTVP